MKKVILAAAFVAAQAAHAADVDAVVENFERTSTGAAEILMKFSNNSGRLVSYASASCGLLDKDERAITEVKVIAQNIAPGARAYGKSYGPNDQRVAKAECRLIAVDYVE